MRQRLSLLAIGGFAAASLLLIHVALALHLAPPGTGFSATFPIEPKEAQTQSPVSAPLPGLPAIGPSSTWQCGHLCDGDRKQDRA
jgi:hypothetical protein